MRTPKRLYAQQRLIYQPELLTCPRFAQPYDDVQQGVAWWPDSAYILAPSVVSPRDADLVASQLRGSLDTVRD
jgi:hypothetical protein